MPDQISHRKTDDGQGVKNRPEDDAPGFRQGLPQFAAVLMGDDKVGSQRKGYEPECKPMRD